MIDYRIITQNQNPSFSQGLSSLASGIKDYSDQIRQSKLADLALQQNKINLDNMRRKQQLQDEESKREMDFRADYQTLQMEGSDTPENVQALYAQYFPEKVANYQMQRTFSDPYAQQKIDLRKESQDLRRQALGIQRSAEERRSKYAPLNFKLKQKNVQSLINKREFDKAAKTQDQIYKMQDYNRELENEKWERDWRLNKSAYEYDVKQDQLLGQVPEIVRRNYIGRAENGGKDLTPENIKYITGGTEGASKILKNTDELLSLIDAYGLEKLPGSAREKMKTLIGNIGLQYKSKEFANLGVLTGPDLDILLSVTGDPTSFTALSSTIQRDKLSQFRQGLVDGYNKALMTRGFSPVNADELSNYATSSATSAVQRLKNRKGR